MEKTHLIKEFIFSVRKNIVFDTLYWKYNLKKKYKFAENLVITEEDEMIKTADMITWSDIIEPTVYADKIDVTNGQLSVRQIGEAF